MDARTSRMLEAARAAAERDRVAAADARNRLAAGNAKAIAEAAAGLRRLFAEVGDPIELAAGAEDIAALLVAIVSAALIDALRIDVRDPRIVKGSIAGPGGSHEVGSVVVDTTDALLPDSLTVSSVDPDNPALADAPLIAMEVAGRINRSTDRVRLLMLGDVDLAASFITELYGLAARGRFTDALDRAVARRLDTTEGDPS